MNFLEIFGFFPQRGGGGGSANPNFFKPKPHGDFVGILGGGSSVPTFFTQKMGLFHEKIICLQ